MKAMLLRECLQTMDLSQTDSELGNQQTQVINVLTKHMKQYLFSVSKGSRMSSNVSCFTILYICCLNNKKKHENCFSGAL